MYEAVVIGASAGGMRALQTVLSGLRSEFPLSVAIVQHVSPSADSYLAEYLDGKCALTVKEAEDKEAMAPGTAYVAPPGYHLLVEKDRSLSLSVDARVNFSCPSIDVLFESAAEAFGRGLIGIVLTGANADGSAGLKSIRARGGLAIVQDPATAEAAFMPRAALETAGADHVAALEEIPALLEKCVSLNEGGAHGAKANG
ncbi:MAG: chemotaxis protein CheB [Alphaproteobacteria bacterium]|nr:chemotaxis protein CheB [Alphaproteobacteria bacterium]